MTEAETAGTRFDAHDRHIVSVNNVWMRFDSCFGIFVIANGILFGAEKSSDPLFLFGIEGPLNQSTVQLWEQVFLAIFTAEFFLRCCLFVQMEVAGNYDRILFIFPLPDEVKWMRLVRNFSWFMDPFRDPWVVFDFVVVSVAIFDVVFFVFGSHWGASCTCGGLEAGLFGLP